MNYEKSKTNGRGNQKNANYAVQPKIEIEKGGFVVVVNFFFFFFFSSTTILEELVLWAS